MVHEICTRNFFKEGFFENYEWIPIKLKGFYEVYDRMDTTSSKDPRLFKQQSQKQKFQLHPK